ncbi:type IV secretion system DNA-binding domain-containing protein [Novosphingobium sp. P6W]|uniref:type IV secretion system DNA-binding domain-containing protein n=1 Tax=Novosphingobium sp. P6W TaxID=1609758 RepID=UPI0005C45756|nr:type IV secretion system DNA-binding domain-containing protein [Novosphingobium sp. P6W]AXB80120.1 conjugal transfer protein TraD [Novosphingobium sp. P6W]
MARKEPKKAPKKAPKKDIRDDGRHIPLEHHTARGDVPRNSGNFTRGSQLLTTQVWMWSQGARLPLVMWLVLFALSYFIILSVTLNENNVQLICMRILSALWDWVALDNLKQVNLRLPDNSVHRTVMGYVPFVPEVAAAWGKAVRGILGSMLIASFVTVPAAIWYVEFANRRGKSIVQERHERGAMLVERDMLYEEIVQHNTIEFEKDAAKLFPNLSVKQVLQLPFADRKAAGIHHPYDLAGIPYPHRLEQSHTMLIGTTGAGKTTVLRHHIAQMRKRQDTAVVFDLTGAYVEAFYDPERDTILNPLDQRCPAWSIFDDCTTYSEFTAAASALIPSDGGSSEPFWALAARTLFIEMCMKLIERGETTNKALADNLMTADLKKVHLYLQKTIADPLTAPEAARMAESIRAVFNTNAQVLRFLPDEGQSYSIRDWMTRDKKPGSILFITSNYTDLEMNRALLTLWSNLAIHALMSMPRTRSLRTWFIFDELGALHRLPAIESGLQTARNFGGAMILGLHSFEKLIQVYGEENARNLSSLARTKLILAAADLDTAEQCSRYIGNREIRQMDEGYSYGYNSTRDASTLTPRKQIEPLVIPDDITNLPALHGFVKFPDGFPAARILLQWRDYPDVAKGFIKRKPKKPDDPEGTVRGRGGKPKGGGDDGGRGETFALTEEEISERDIPVAFAAGILSAPSEEQERQARDVAREIAERIDPSAPRDTDRKPSSDTRDERERSTDATNVVPIKQSDRDKDTPRPEQPDREDLGVREARENFSREHGDDDMGIGD